MNQTIKKAKDFAKTNVAKVRRFAKADTIEKCHKIIKTCDRFDDIVFEKFHYHNSNMIHVLPLLARIKLLSEGEIEMVSSGDYDDIIDHSLYHNTCRDFKGCEIHIVDNDYYYNTYNSYNKTMFAISYQTYNVEGDDIIKYLIVIPEKTYDEYGKEATELLAIITYNNALNLLKKVIKFIPRDVAEIIKNSFDFENIETVKELSTKYLTEEEFKKGYNELQFHTPLKITDKIKLAKAYIS